MTVVAVVNKEIKMIEEGMCKKLIMDIFFKQYLSFVSMSQINVLMNSDKNILKNGKVKMSPSEIKELKLFI